MSRLRWHIGILAVLAFSALGPASADYLPGGSWLKMSTAAAAGVPYGVSADGTYLVGNGGYTGLPSGDTDAFRWTRAGGYQWLGSLPTGPIFSYGYGVSADGNVVAGQDQYGTATNQNEAFRWTPSTGMVGLGFLPGHDTSTAYGVSADGTVISGTSRNTLDASGQRAFRWTEAGGMQSLGSFVAGGRSYGTGISPDGSTILGSADVDTAYHQNAARWTQAGGWQSLGVLPGGEAQNNSTAGASSTDGSVVGGMSSSAMSSVGEAFRWTAAGGMQGLGFLGGFFGTYISTTMGVSGDGAILVGISTSASNYEEAVIWDQAHGIRLLQDVLTNDYGVTIQSGYRLAEATGISQDGKTIIGNGYRNGNLSGWVATIPEPSALSLLVVGLLATLRRRA